MKPVVVVTGASKGIGLAATRILLKKFQVNVIAISRSHTQELVELSSDSLMVIQCDVADEKALANAIIAGASHYHNRLDGLVLNAATLDPCCRIGDDTPLDAWKSHFDVNFFSLVAAVKAALPFLRKSVLGGKVVFVSSGAAIKGMAGWGPYNASKAAMNSLSRTLAQEEPDVTSVAVRPGMVDTNMQDAIRATGAAYLYEKDYNVFVKAHADGGLVNPEDCGHVIASLSLQASKNLSGQFVSWDSDECKAYRKDHVQVQGINKSAHFCTPSLKEMVANSLMSRTLLNPKIRRIDVHHHFFPPDLNKVDANSKLGWKTPEGNLPWSPKVSLDAMDSMNIDVAILSLPPISSGSIGEENRATARKRNEYVANVCSEYPDRFGFFATLPFLDDASGCLQEIEYALDNLHAYGISLASCYGDGAAAKYVGHESYHTIWAELNRRKAVVFLHGSQIPSSTPYPHGFLGVPITEAPNETFKAAAHLVVTRHRRMFPDVKIILAHLGGTTPFLASRVAVLSNHMGCPLSPEEILDDFRSFYYETALSAHEPNLLAVEKFVHEDHILFGSDFPAVSKDMVEWYTSRLENFYASNPERLNEILVNNALRVFLGAVCVEKIQD